MEVFAFGGSEPLHRYRDLVDHFDGHSKRPKRPTDNRKWQLSVRGQVQAPKVVLERRCELEHVHMGFP